MFAAAQRPTLNLRLYLPIAFGLVVGCSSGDPAGEMSQCAQEDAAFVREAMLALVGRRPLSENETTTAVRFIEQVDRQRNSSELSGRRVWARGLMRTPAFRDHYQEIILDALRTPRIGFQHLYECYGERLLDDESASLAQHVRDNPALTGFGTAFSFLDLLRSSLVLDDLSPIYRAHLFAMISKPNVCPNVPPVEQELSLRQEVGHIFEAAYTNRDQVCLACHNSEQSVTYDPLPERNRHFAIDAFLEQSVFGSSAGVPERQTHAVFRIDGFLVDRFINEDIPVCDSFLDAFCERGQSTPTCEDSSVPQCFAGGTPTCTSRAGEVYAECISTSSAATPWGADSSCMSFTEVTSDDPAGIQASLASISGKRTSILDLEQAIARGVVQLKTQGLVLDEQKVPKDADAALAYLVALNITDTMWRELTGSPLTITTGFSRTQATHDMLKALTDNFLAHDFSLQTLVLDILETPYFNERAPVESCASAFNLPSIFNVWVRSEPEPEHRGNSAADGVHPLSARTLISATNAALDWPMASNARFPESCKVEKTCEELERACRDSARCCGRLYFECLRSPDPSCVDLDECRPLQQSCDDSGECCIEAALVCSEGIDNPEAQFQRSTGVFMRMSEQGFRGLDPSGRLSWEERYGACRKPDGVESDALDQIFSGASQANASLEDVVLAMKDRLVAEAQLDDLEREAIEALLGALLSEQFNEGHEVKLRLWCGALLSSPQHLLTGLATRGGKPPMLGPSLASTCVELKAIDFVGYSVDCSDDGQVQVSRSR